MGEAFVVESIRTPIGRRNGALAGVRAEELAAQSLNGLVGRLDLDPAEIEDVQMGCVSQVGEQALNIARMSSLGVRARHSATGAAKTRFCVYTPAAAQGPSATISDKSCFSGLRLTPVWTPATRKPSGSVWDMASWER